MFEVVNNDIACLLISFTPVESQRSTGWSAPEK